MERRGRRRRPTVYAEIACRKMMGKRSPSDERICCGFKAFEAAAKNIQRKNFRLLRRMRPVLDSAWCYPYHSIKEQRLQSKRRQGKADADRQGTSPLRHRIERRKGASPWQSSGHTTLTMQPYILRTTATAQRRRRKYKSGCSACSILQAGYCIKMSCGKSWRLKSAIKAAPSAAAWRAVFSVRRPLARERTSWGT